MNVHHITRYFLTGAILTLAAATMSSCSLLDEVKGKFKRDAKPKSKVEAVLPQDREQIQEQARQKQYSPEELAKGVVRGDWAIEEVAGKPAVGEKPPFLKFETDSKRVYGNNGCNVLNGKYTYNPQDSTISFQDVVTTMMACGNREITDVEINLALNNTRTYTWSLSDDDDTYYLYFYDAGGQRVMTLMHQNFAFLNGTWRVVSIDEDPVNVPDMKLVIDVDEGKLHGNTGCNILNGTLDTDMDTPNSISFQQIALTKMACPDPQYQTRLIVALEDAAQAKPVSKDKVLLLNNQQQVVLTLVRTSDTD